MTIQNICRGCGRDLTNAEHTMTVAKDGKEYKVCGPGLACITAALSALSASSPISAALAHVPDTKEKP